MVALLSAVADEVLLDEPYRTTLGDGVWVHRRATACRRTGSPPTATSSASTPGWPSTASSTASSRPRAWSSARQLRDFTTRLNKLAGARQRPRARSRRGRGPRPMRMLPSPAMPRPKPATIKGGRRRRSSTSRAPLKGLTLSSQADDRRSADRRRSSTTSWSRTTTSTLRCRLPGHRRRSSVTRRLPQPIAAALIARSYGDSRQAGLDGVPTCATSIVGRSDGVRRSSRPAVQPSTQRRGTATSASSRTCRARRRHRCMVNGARSASSASLATAPAQPSR